MTIIKAFFDGVWYALLGIIGLVVVFWPITLASGSLHPLWFPVITAVWWGGLLSVAIKMDWLPDFDMAPRIPPPPKPPKYKG